VQIIKTSGVALAVTLFIVFHMVGCAGVSPVKPQEVKETKPQVKQEDTEKGWWYARFRMNWPPKADPAWHVDLLLAREVISTILEQYKSELLLWRFHRRAARDKTGHQFSFIFYSSPKTARQIFSALRSDHLLKTLKTNGMIVRDIYDDTSQIKRPDIDDTSDRHWSPPVKKTWPYFIMGVSEMWLKLIAEISAQPSNANTSASLRQKLDFYRDINEILLDTWKDQGRHALLHHLNAVFGYAPLVVYEKRLMNF
jgi:hypothetical protein